MWELKKLRERFSSTCAMRNLYGTVFSGTSYSMSCPHHHERVQQVRHFHLRLQTLINREAYIIHHQKSATISPKRIRVREYRNVAPAKHGCLCTLLMILQSQMGSMFSSPDTKAPVSSISLKASTSAFPNMPQELWYNRCINSFLPVLQRQFIGQGAD